MKRGDMMESIWRKTTAMPQFEHLRGDRKTDVLIIGGGIAGLLCAYHLRRAGVDCLLVEAKKICGGVTGDTTAKLTSQHGLCYHRIAKRYSMEAAGLYLEANERALAKYRRLCGKIDCGFEERDNYVYTLRDREGMARELTTLHRLRFQADFAEELPLPMKTSGAVRFPRQAQFHPLQFLGELSKELPICEHTKVLELMPKGAITEHGRVTAEKIVIATHFPILNKHGLYFMKQYQHRSYVLSLEQAELPHGMYVDDDEKGLSFRSYGKRLLLGGGGHRTGKQGGNWTELRRFAAVNYPTARETAHWAAQDCMTLDGIPYIGRYAGSVENVYVATGFNKWGMTSAMVAGELLRDLILERENPYASVFSPQRSMLHPKLMVHMGETALSMVTPTVPRCPHMGCALKYNRAEHSWDCPCHGSRFSDEGELLDGPATDDRR